MAQNTPLDVAREVLPCLWISFLEQWNALLILSFLLNPRYLEAPYCQPFRCCLSDLVFLRSYDSENMKFHWNISSFYYCTVCSGWKSNWGDFHHVVHEYICKRNVFFFNKSLASILPGGIVSQPSDLVLLLYWSKPVNVWIYLTFTMYWTRAKSFLQNNPQEVNSRPFLLVRKSCWLECVCWMFLCLILILRGGSQK